MFLAVLHPEATVIVICDSTGALRISSSLICICMHVVVSLTFILELDTQVLFKMQFEHGKLHKGGSILGTIFSASRKPRVEPTLRKREAYPQNVDLPPILPKQKKKPYPIPFKKIKQVAKEDKKLAEMGIEKPLDPPKNGLLAPDLIPVAYQVLDAWKVLIKGLAQLLHVIPVYGCK